jgi:hypothetical protein
MPRVSRIPRGVDRASIALYRSAADRRDQINRGSSNRPPGRHGLTDTVWILNPSSEFVEDIINRNREMNSPSHNFSVLVAPDGTLTLR